MSELVEAWRIHNRIQLYVLDAIEPEALAISGPKGRTVGAQFVHLNNVRRMWLEASAPDLAADVAKIDPKTDPDKALIREALERSGDAISVLIARGEEAERVKGFKPSPTAFFGYLVSHESYHQGDIGVRLTEIGHPLDRTTSFGIWEWGVR